MTYFSVIVPDYHESVSNERRIRCITNLLTSSFPYFEVHWIHDGPAPPSYWRTINRVIGNDERFVLSCSERRFGNYGHSLRDLGIDKSSGKYIIHLNADNSLYPNAMEVLYRRSLGPHYSISAHDQEKKCIPFHFNPGVMIYAIKMMGRMNVFSGSELLRSKDYSGYIDNILPGWPPRFGKIDAMQLVAERRIWIERGGWHDLSMNSDGILLPEIADSFGYCIIPEVLGEHW